MTNDNKGFALSRPPRDLPDVADDKIESLTARQEGRLPETPLPDEEPETPAPRRSQKARDEDKPTPASDFMYANVGFPSYLMKQLRVRCATQGTTLKYELMRALKRTGDYEIRQADMVKDARGKTKKKR